jgi:diguanylate cyclase (GGDEF)-like protein
VVLLESVAFYVDGGLRSPLLLIYIAPVMFSSAFYRPRYVGIVGAESLVATMVLAATTPAVEPAVVVAVVGTMFLTTLFAVSLAQTNHQRLERNAELTAELERLARIDGLTGCLTRRAFQDELDRLTLAAVETRSWLSFLMVDLDHFKAVNDTYGHATGDRLLELVGAGLRESVRPVDAVGRVGGEEFGIVVWQDSRSRRQTALATDAVAQRVRSAIESIAEPVTIGVSIGIAAAPAELVPASQLVELADEALYIAKRQGRGRTVWSAHSFMDPVPATRAAPSRRSDDGVAGEPPA